MDGNFSGNLNTNLPSYFNKKIEIKPLELNFQNNTNIKAQKVEDCFDQKGNFYLSGVIPARNDNNLNESINNSSMTNLL